jgi:hypothetical protein
MLVLLSVLLIGPASTDAHASTPSSSAVWSQYGDSLSRGRMQRVGSVTAPSREGKTLRVQGTIAEVCQAKGCWMTVGDGDAALRVEFKDYGFFVPSTSAGKPVQMEGVVIERTMSEAEREHLRAESESGAEIPERVLVFVASGVKVQGGGPIPEGQQRRIDGKKAAPDSSAAH